MAHENISHREASIKQQNSFASVVQNPIRCTPEDFPSLYENRKRKKISPIVNTIQHFRVDNQFKDDRGNGVYFMKANLLNSLEMDSSTLLIDKLVSAVMQLSKKENLIPTECADIIKSILEPLLHNNISNSQSSQN